jgi:hypothetical protein
MRQSHLGKKQSSESIAKRAKAMVGHLVSEATRRKISESNMGHVYYPRRKS